MKTIVYYHKNSNLVAFKRVKDSNGYNYEITYDEKGNQLTFKSSSGRFEIKGESVSKEEFEEFINNQNRPCVGKKVVVDGVEYELR